MTLCTNPKNGQGSPASTSKKEVVDRKGKDSGIPQYKITTINCHVAPLYQDNPFIKSTFTRYTNWSLTDSLESYQNRAWKETMILRRNNRVPTKEFVWHFLKVLSAKDISTYRTKIFRVLTDNGTSTKQSQRDQIEILKKRCFSTLLSLFTQYQMVFLGEREQYPREQPPPSTFKQKFFILEWQISGKLLQEFSSLSPAGFHRVFEICTKLPLLFAVFSLIWVGEVL